MYKLLVFCLCAATLLAQDGASKVNEVLVKLKEPKQGTKLETFVIEENDLNEFAEAAIESKKRLGVQTVEFDLQGAGRFQGTALINMDEVELTGFTARAFKAMLSGNQTLKAVGKITTSQGQGTCALESASVNNIPIPAWLANSVIGYLSSRQPPYVDISEPFELPYEVQEISVTRDRIVLLR